MNAAPQQIEECRYCGAAIEGHSDDPTLWTDEAGACGCGIGEHEPGGFDEYANVERTAETPWWS